MRSHLHALLAVTGACLCLGCQTGRDASRSSILNPTRERSHAECRRRASAMAEQDREINQDPNRPGTFRGWRDGPGQDGFSGGPNDPCARERGTEEWADAQMERRDLAKTRARMLLDERRFEDALEAIEPAFYAGGPPDPDLYELSDRIMTGRQQAIARAHRASGSLARRGSQTACLVTAAPSSMELLDELLHLVEGPTTVHVTCGLPPIDTQLEGREARVVLRRHLGDSRFDFVEEVELGPLAELAGQQVVRASFSLPGPGVDEASAYYDVALVAARPGRAPLVLTRDVILWFRE